MKVKWLGIKLGGTDPMEVLADLARNKTPIRVEVEGAHVRFRSQLTLKHGMAVISKPSSVGEALSKGSFVRFKLPGQGRKEIRLEVTMPHVNLDNGGAVFLCKALERSQTESKRLDERYDVSRYKNLQLMLNQGEAFRVLDLSLGGCRVATAGEVELKYFPLNHPLPASQLHLGKNVKVDLEKLFARAHHGLNVACEFHVPPNTISHKYLSHLVESLDAKGG